MIRTLVAAALTATTAVAGPLAATYAHASTTPAVAGSAQESHQRCRSRWPWMSIALPHTVKGRTLTYSYADAGCQYLVHEPGQPPHDNGESAGYLIDFGDGTLPDGANGTGGAECLTSGTVAPFRDNTPKASHRYAHPGRYTVTVTGYYCGVGKNPHVTRTYRVVAR